MELMRYKVLLGYYSYSKLSFVSQDGLETLSPRDTLSTPGSECYVLKAILFVRAKKGLQTHYSIVILFATCHKDVTSYFVLPVYQS